MASITELRDWATMTFGAHSHKECQVFAALEPLEEWLGHLARHGISLELVPKGESVLVAPTQKIDPVVISQIFAFPSQMNSETEASE